MPSNQTKWLFGCGITLVMLIGFGLVIILATIALRDDTFSVPSLRPAVAVVEVFGVIGDDDGILRQLERVEDDGSVEAVVLHINSPGGSVAVTQRIVGRLDALREEGIPIVAAMETVAASGAYYIAVSSDSILTLPGTLTGSIGAIMSFPQASELMDKIGVGLEVIKTGPQKDTGSFHRPLEERERRWLQEVLDDVERQFVEAIYQGRPELSREEIQSVADGRIFSGRMAVELGLADRIGTLEDAIDTATTLADIEGSYRVVRKRTRSHFLESWLEERFQGLARLALPGVQRPTLEYRWR